MVTIAIFAKNLSPAKDTVGDSSLPFRHNIAIPRTNGQTYDIDLIANNPVLDYNKIAQKALRSRQCLFFARKTFYTNLLYIIIEKYHIGR